MRQALFVAGCLFLLVRQGMAFDCSTATENDICSSPGELVPSTCHSGVCVSHPFNDITGTGTISSSSDAITGSGTDFVNQINVGWIFQAGGQTDVVFSITDATHLHLVNGFAPDVSAVAYTLRPPIARWMDSSGNVLLMLQGDGHLTIGPGVSRALLDVEAGVFLPAVSSGNGINATQLFFFDGQTGGATTDTAGTGGTGSSGFIGLEGGGNAPLTPGVGGSLTIQGSQGGAATSGSGTGGLGGPITIQAGNGGVVAGGGTNGTGNDVILRGGPKGTGGSGGSPGNVKIADQGGNLKFGQTTSPASQLQFFNTNGTVTALQRGAATADIVFSLPAALPGTNNSPVLSSTAGLLSFGAVPNTAGACSAGQYETADNAGAVPTCADASGVGACAAGKAATTLNAGAAPTCTTVSGTGACAAGKSVTTINALAAPTCTDTSGVGACAAGQAVTTINALAAPTCTAVSGTGSCSAGQYVSAVNGLAAPTCVTEGAVSETFTNKTLDVEATGNVVTTVSKLWIPAASCNNATPAPNLDLPTSAAPTAACVTGTNIQKGVLQYADGADSSAQTTLFLPTDWSGNVDAKVLFTSADVTNAQTEKWTVATSCRTPTGGTGATDDRAFNTAQTLTYTLGASEVASALRSVSQTSVTMTNCVAGDLWHVKVGRDTTDTDTTTMNLVGLELTLRRAQ